MRLAASELDSESGDYVAAANVVKSCAEALYAIRKINHEDQDTRKKNKKANQKCKEKGRNPSFAVRVPPGQYFTSSRIQVYTSYDYLLCNDSSDSRPVVFR